MDEQRFKELERKRFEEGLSDEEANELGRMMAEQGDQPRKLSRQQLRAQGREKHDAEGWIAALDIQDPAVQRANRAAVGPHRVTRAEL